MQIKVKNKKITNVMPKKTNVTSFKQSVLVVGDIPTDGTVVCFLKGVPFSTYFPLDFKEVTDEGAIFKGEMFFSDEVLDYVSKHNKVYGIEVRINEVKVKGIAELEFISDRINTIKNTVINNDYKKLLREVNQLKRKLNIYISKSFTRDIPNKPDGFAKEGMIPVVIDNVGNIKYDYPFADLETKVKNLSDATIKLAEVVEKTTERINELEETVNDHVNKGVIGR